MGSQTICGEVQWVNGRVNLVFTDPECPDTMFNDPYPCINFGQGIHHGMVELYHPNCDTTYYGCVDWSLGTWQVVVPDDCCGGTAIPCAQCPGGSTAPYSVEVTITGSSSLNTWGNVSCGAWRSYKYTGASVDGVFSIPAYLACDWRKIDCGSFGEVTFYTSDNCAGSVYAVQNFNTRAITVSWGSYPYLLSVGIRLSMSAPCGGLGLTCYYQPVLAITTSTTFTSSQIETGKCCVTTLSKASSGGNMSATFEITDEA